MFVHQTNLEYLFYSSTIVLGKYASEAAASESALGKVISTAFKNNNNDYDDDVDNNNNTILSHVRHCIASIHALKQL